MCATAVPAMVLLLLRADMGKMPMLHMAETAVLRLHAIALWFYALTCWQIASRLT